MRAKKLTSGQLSLSHVILPYLRHYSFSLFSCSDSTPCSMAVRATLCASSVAYNYVKSVTSKSWFSVFYSSSFSDVRVSSGTPMGSTSMLDAKMSWSQLVYVSKPAKTSSSNNCFQHFLASASSNLFICVHILLTYSSAICDVLPSGCWRLSHAMSLLHTRDTLRAQKIHTVLSFNMKTFICLSFQNLLSREKTELLYEVWI